MDRENVIKGYKVCVEHGLLNGEDCHGYHKWKDNHYEIEKVNDYSKECPYNGCETGCVKTLGIDVLALLKEQKETIRNLEQEIRDKNERLKERAEQVDSMLKEQEAVKPKHYEATRYNGELFACGDCRHELELKPRFCPYCGKAVKWE